MKINKKLEFDFLANQFQLIQNRIYYSEKHKVAFLLTPKCGCSFMKAFFLLNFTDYNQHELAYDDHQELVDNFSRKWLKEHPAPLEIFNDQYSSWNFGQFDFIDSIKDLQDGSRTRFPIIYNSNLLSFISFPCVCK